MANFVMLNQEQHADIKVIDERSQVYGDNVMYAMTFPFEFRNVQGSYPHIFSEKRGNRRFFSSCAIWIPGSGKPIFR